MSRKKPLRPRPILAEGARVIGVDPSLTGTGVAVYDDRGGWRTGTVASAPHGGELRALFERLDRIAEGVEEFVGGWEPTDLVVVEGYMLLAQGSSRGPIIANWHSVVGGIVRAGLDPVEIAPATRQKYAVGGAKGGKDQVMAQCYRRFPQAQVDTNDEADAVFLAAIGRHLAGRSIEPAPLPATHLTVDRLFEPLAEAVPGA